MVSTLPVSYTTVDRVYSTYPRLGSVSTVSSSDIALFIGRAQAEVNARIVRRYELPLTTEVYQLEGITNDIALHDVLKERVFASEQFDESPWPDAYKRAFSRLEEIASGKVPLVDSSGQLLTRRTDNIELTSNNIDYHPTFSELGEFDQIQDVDKIDDLEDDRDL